MRRGQPFEELADYRDNGGLDHVAGHDGQDPGDPALLSDEQARAGEAGPVAGVGGGAGVECGAGIHRECAVIEGCAGGCGGGCWGRGARSLNTSDAGGLYSAVSCWWRSTSGRPEPSRVALWRAPASRRDDEPVRR